MNKKLLITSLLAATLFSQSAQAAQINGNGVVDASLLNVRSSPDMSAEIVGSLADASKVNIITKTGDWFEIEFEDKICYVHSDYINPSRKRGVSKKSAVQSVSGREKGEAVVKLAKSFLGVPYLWGGESPDGFDCSGLVYYVYGEFGVDLYRVAKDMEKNGTEVDLLSLMPGDIVLFWNRDSYSEINHVGIYVGNNSFIHSPQTGDVVKISTLESGYYAKNLVAARRIFE